MDAVSSECSGIVVYGGGDIVFDAKRSNQRMQWMQYAVEYWYMVVGTLSVVQKGQTRGCSGCSTQWNSGIWWWGHCSLMQKGQTSGCSVQWTQWTQYTVDAVDAVVTICSGRSRIVVYGGGDIVFGAKRSNQWIQWMQSHSGHGTQWIQWTQYTVE